MRIKVVGDNDCARALRGMLRQAGFAVVEFLPAEVVRELPSGGYAIYIEESPERLIRFDSADSELEARILRQVTQLCPEAVVVDRPGGQVHSEREIRILVPAGNPVHQAAVEYGVLRGLMDLAKPLDPGRAREEQEVAPWWQKFFGAKR